MSMQPLYRILAALVGQHARCVETHNKEWEEKSRIRAEELTAEYMPRGSGFDNGTHLDLGVSTSNKLVFRTSYHHMIQNGMYDGWTEHTVTVRPSLESPGFTLSISGRNRNEIKDAIHEGFNWGLCGEIEQYPESAPAIDPVR